jgi:hypothetical protein
VYQPEVTLWRAVIFQAFLDSVAKDTLYSKRTRSRMETESARKFLLGETPMLAIACTLANLSRRKVQAEAVRRAAAGWPLMPRILPHQVDRRPS